MTEAEWLYDGQSLTLTLKLFNYCRHNLSARKKRLFAAACCRHLDPSLADRQTRLSVAVAEGIADGLIDREGQLQAIKAAVAFARPLGKARAVTFLPRDLVRLSPDHCVYYTTAEAARLTGNEATARQAQARLLRDIVGNPFRPVGIPCAWLTPTIIALAQAAYDERQMPAGSLDRDRLLVLADALEESGCDNTEVLGHLRGPGPHVRGCHVLDALLGRK